MLNSYGVLSGHFKITSMLSFRLISDDEDRDPKTSVTAHMYSLYMKSSTSTDLEALLNTLKILQRCFCRNMGRRRQKRRTHSKIGRHIESTVQPPKRRVQIKL